MDPPWLSAGAYWDNAVVKEPMHRNCEEHVTKGMRFFGWKMRHFVYKVYLVKDPTSQIVKWYHLKSATVATLKLEGPLSEEGKSRVPGRMMQRWMPQAILFLHWTRHSQCAASYA